MLSESDAYLYILLCNKFITVSDVYLFTYFVSSYLYLTLPFDTLYVTFFYTSHVLLKRGLTLSQTTNFRLFQTERVCRRQFQIGLERIENAVGKGEIARCEQFLLFPQCFQKTCIQDT